MGPARRVTLRTLAVDLGVSPATVSNAYNRPDQLSAALRERILGRAAELGFAGPDPMARGLRRGRVGAIGVLVDEGLSYAFSDPTAVLFLDGLAREVQADGYGLLLHAGTSARTDLQHLRSAAVDAWVLQSLPGGHPAVAAVVAQQRPIVVLDQPDLPGCPLVSIDEDAGGAMAVAHLLELGHRRIAVLTMPLHADGDYGPADQQRQDTAAYEVMRRRLVAARLTVTAAGLDWGQVPVYECPANDPDSGAAVAAVLLGSGSPPTAVLALTDQLAIGVLRAARDAGVSVPGRLSVMGFDDSPPAYYAQPPLTTIAQPLLDRGRVVGALVRALLAGEPAQSPPPFPVHLVRRRSTAPPSA